MSQDLCQKSSKVPLWWAALAVTAISASMTTLSAPGTAYSQTHSQTGSQTGSQTRAKGLFNSVEMRRTGVHLLRKWNNVLRRAQGDRQVAVACDPKGAAPCHVRQWKAFLARTRTAKPLAQLRAVNRYINQWRYVDDRANYGKVDYWATPRQLFHSGGGDCEDYAIAKYMSLRAMGWPADKLRIVVLQDQNLGIAHAVLSVELNGTFYILDNQIRAVVDHRRIRHYRPIYSMNERHWWFHRVRRNIADRS